jgi:hypothetical protein
LGIGDWGLGIGDWGLGPIPNPHWAQPPIPIPNPINFLFNINKLFNYILKATIFKKIVNSASFFYVYNGNNFLYI